MSKAVLGLLMVVVTLSSGCTAILKNIKSGQAESSKREAPLMSQASTNDGYQMITSVDWHGELQGVVGKPFKFCKDVDLVLEQPDNASWYPTIRADIANLKAKGKIPNSGRYYAWVGGHTLISVPEMEHADFISNAREGKVCFWSNGNVEQIMYADKTSSHVTVDRWDGVLRHPAPEEPAQSSNGSSLGR